MARLKRKYVSKEPIFGWAHYNKIKKQVNENTVENRQYVYLIKSESGLFKIGISTNPRARLSAIISSSGMGAELLAFYKTELPARDIEKKLHKLFETYRVRGEWFDFPDTYSLERFETLCERFGMTPQKFVIEEERIVYEFENKEKEEVKTKRQKWLEYTEKVNREWEESKKTNG